MKITGSTASEIFESVRSQVGAGSIAANASLPPVRDLGAALGVNRNTVAAAYRKLILAGLVESRGRRGTVVRQQHITPQEHEGLGASSKLVDLASGNPNPNWLPDLAKLLPAIGKKPRLYGEPPVNARLETLGRDWFNDDCPASYELNLTNGAVDAIERLAAARLLPGDTVAVEDPCFLGSINALRFSGMRVIGIPVDAEGIQTSHLEKALAEGARAVLITARAHNPTGCSLSSRRSRELRRVLAKFPEVLVIIDDHFGLIAATDYHSALPSQTTHWALIRSVSKALGPDFRFAFVASDKWTSERLRRRLNSGTSWVNHLIQDLVIECLESKAVRQLLVNATKYYAGRRASLVSKLVGIGLDSLLADPDGLNIWIPLERESGQVALALASRGWMVRTGEAFAVQSSIQAIRVTVSNWNAEDEKRFISDLKDCLAL